MSPVEIGLSIRPRSPAEDVANVVRAEAEGFDSALYGESPYRFGDPFARIAAAVASTTRIRFVAIATNPVTRTPAVTAALATTLQAHSGGRHVLGLARGDTALSDLGGPAPASLADFTAYVERVRADLTGPALRWRPAELPPVPVEIAATGPRVIAYAASVADRVSLAVGAAPERVVWAVRTARATAEAAGRDPAALRVGAYVHVAVDDDVDAAVELMRRPIEVHARFHAMRGAPVGDHPPELGRVTVPLEKAMRAGDESAARRLVDPEFVRWFGVVGGAARVTAALRGLTDLGLDYLYILNANQFEPEFSAASRSRFVKEVLPALRC